MSKISMLCENNITKDLENVGSQEKNNVSGKFSHKSK
jgi:hypothetical protein